MRMYTRSHESLVEDAPSGGQFSAYGVCSKMHSNGKKIFSGKEEWELTVRRKQVLQGDKGQNMSRAQIATAVDIS